MLISIITVVKNNKSQISHTLQSIINQKFKKIELIVIDGYSDDGTEIIVKKYFKQFKLIRKKDKSVYESLNYACKIAKGDYVSFLHSGDLYINNNILNKVSKKSKKSDLISTNIAYFGDDLQISRVWNSDNQISKKHIINLHTLVFFIQKILLRNLNMTRI